MQTFIEAFPGDQYRKLPFKTLIKSIIQMEGKSLGNELLNIFPDPKYTPSVSAFVQQRQNKAPKLFLVEGRRGGKPSSLIVEKTLLIEDEKGEFSQEMKEIYGCYKENYL